MMEKAIGIKGSSIGVTQDRIWEDQIVVMLVWTCFLSIFVKDFHVWAVHRLKAADLEASLAIQKLPATVRRLPLGRLKLSMDVLHPLSRRPCF